MIKPTFSQLKTPLTVLSLALSASLITGCAVSYTPTSTTAKVASDLPSVTRAASRQAPKAKSDVLSIHIPYEKSVPDEGNYVSRVIEIKSLYPSVILNIPSDMSNGKKVEKELAEKAERAWYEVKEELLTEAYKTKARDYNTDFETKQKFMLDFYKKENIGYSTANYFNIYEQEIEKAMIRKGFNVLDRAKFEAKLRDLRDNSNKEYNKRGPGFYMIKKKLDKQLENGEIDNSEYMNEIAKADAQSKQASTGKKRKENEMIDISEIIRAAQGSGGGTGPNNAKADFLLQINNVKVENSFDHPLELYGFQETKSFLKKYPGLNLGNRSGEIPRSIPRPWYKAFFNAKLIDIKTGKIVWIGEHIAESKSANKEGIRIDFNVERYVSNQNDVNMAIRNYNSELQDKSTRLSNLNTTLNRLYVKQTQAKEFADENQKNYYLRNLTNSISQTEKEYRALMRDLIDMDNNKPSNVYAEWEYAYHVSDPIVQPLMITDSNDPKMIEKVEAHKKDLVKEVISTLVETITLKQKMKK